MSPLYFDHDQENLSVSLGISPGRKNQLSKELNHLVNNKIAANKNRAKISEVLEEVMNLCKNEQERVLMAFYCGEKHGENKPTSIDDVISNFMNKIRKHFEEDED